MNALTKELALKYFKDYCSEESIDPENLEYVRDIEIEEMSDFAKLDNGYLNDTAPKNIEDLMRWKDQGFLFTSCEILDAVRPSVILKVNDSLGGYICISRDIYKYYREDK